MTGSRLPAPARFRDDEPRHFRPPTCENCGAVLPRGSRVGEPCPTCGDERAGDRVLFAVMLVPDRGGPEAARLDSAWTSQPDAELRCEELWRLFGVWRVPLSAVVAKIDPPAELAIRWPA